MYQYNRLKDTAIIKNDPTLLKTGKATKAIRLHTSDRSTRGILISEIMEFFNSDKNSYIIPYDTNKHELATLDFNIIKEVPDSIDPVGWNRLYQFSDTVGLLEHGIKLHHKAKVVL